jgi:trimethylamine--corrinoid protein Co-methyltransferase
MALMGAALAQLAQRYRLPLFSTSGCSDSQVVDIQAALEGGLQDLISAAMGEGLVHDVHCWLDHGSALSPAYLVLGQEILSMTRKFMEGLTVSDESLAIEVIEKVGPGGNFLRERHTLRHFKEMLYPALCERVSHDNWLSRGAPSFEDRLRDRTLSLIASEDANPLDPKIVKELDRRQKSWERR